MIQNRLKRLWNQLELIGIEDERYSVKLTTRSGSVSGARNQENAYETLCFLNIQSIPKGPAGGLKSIIPRSKLQIKVVWRRGVACDAEYAF